MFLEKLEIQGFKSFAQKNTLIFPGKAGEKKKGMTVIVGPNGSGKSNVADAVRWALGEQSMKTLRAKTNEDVIFAGSSMKNQLSMAEVSLYLNNEDKQAPIDYSELVITRRLFRSGESEYLLNNARTRLSDIQILLAKANFGQKTYSVIGQGMVEGFLQTTASERKEFFDEATGVKQFQIKRDISLNKLIASYENLGQANMLINEIDPRLKGLTRQVNKLRQKDEIEKNLKEKRTLYFKKIWHTLNDKLNSYNGQILKAEEEFERKSKELRKQNEELNKMEEESGESDQANSLNHNLNERQQEKEEILKKIAGIDAQMSMELEASGNFDLSWLYGRETELKKEAEETIYTINALKKDLEEKKSKSSRFEEEKEYLNNRTDSLNKKLESLSEINEAEGALEEKINEKLEKVREYLGRLEKEEDIKKVRELLAKIRVVINEIIEFNKKNSSSFSQNDLEKQRDIQGQLISLSKERETLIIKESGEKLEIKSLEERLDFKEKNYKKIKDELEEIAEKISKNTKKEDKQENRGLEDKKEKLEVDLKNILEEIAKIKNELEEITRKEEDKRSYLFKLQREGQNLQMEINELSNELNGLKIEATKYETKLEDLESDIRNTMDNIKEIRENKTEEELNTGELLEEIKKLENQSNLIGGIDPAIEKEYEEIKERYDFLSEQVGDLSEAACKLEEIIKELDNKIKEKFNKEFKTICNKFEEYFKILFSGGSAKIIKLSVDDASKDEKKEGEEEEEKKTEADGIKDKIKNLIKFSATGLAGIEIQACPPGKKIKSLSMLSGGEKALTAIALICAIISANPSPFVVLDEVDAALDEANSERLARILDDLGHKTQFIIITHNRASMRRANVLYGVTMGDDGVSKLLSVKLEDYLKK